VMSCVRAERVLGLAWMGSETVRVQIARIPIFVAKIGDVDPVCMFFSFFWSSLVFSPFHLLIYQLSTSCLVFMHSLVAHVSVNTKHYVLTSSETSNQFCSIFNSVYFI